MALRWQSGRVLRAVWYGILGSNGSLGAGCVDFKTSRFGARVLSTLQCCALRPSDDLGHYVIQMGSDATASYSHGRGWKCGFPNYPRSGSYSKMALMPISTTRSSSMVVRENVDWDGDGDGEALLIRFLEKLKNYEKEGVPKGAGTDSVGGFDLQRMKRLLVRLGNPLSAYPVVHVAGTKGKGSTVSFISSILRAAGLSVGTYTSPHITSIRERITAGKNGDPISINTLRKLVTDLQATIDAAVAEESGLLTHFEVLTAMAFTHFARENVDVAVVETGLGGARDATNVISARELAVAVIVGIGCEHLAALGGTLESIALAKAGIIKENRPVVIGPQRDSRVYKIIEKVAAAKGAPLIAPLKSLVECKVEMLWNHSEYPFQLCDLVIQNPPGPCYEASQEEYKMDNVKLRALGAHQRDNALTALSTVLALRTQGWLIPDCAIRAGLEATDIPGRFQILGSERSKALGCHFTRVILDGAHTEESAMALAKTLRGGFPTARVAFVVAMASDKDQRAFARAVLRDAKPDVVITTRVPVAGSYRRSSTAQELAECWTHTAQALNVNVCSETRKIPYDSWQQDFKEPFPSTGSNDKRQQWETISSFTERKENERGDSLLILSIEPVNAAIEKAVATFETSHRQGEEKPVVCVTGSLHAVAATLSLHNNEHTHC